MYLQLSSYCSTYFHCHSCLKLALFILCLLLKEEIHDITRGAHLTPSRKNFNSYAPIATKVVCFSLLLKCLRSLYGKQCGPRSDCSSNSVDPDQTAPIGAICSGSTLFASILNSSLMLGNYLQQMTSADDIFRCIFSWRFKG